MKDIPREVQIWKIIEEDLPDEIGVSSEDYFFAGWQYEYGINTVKSFEYAVKAYEIALSKGYLKASRALGDIHKKNGNIPEAYKWYLEGCLNEEVDAFSAYELGMMYQSGEYVSRNYAKAFSFFEMAYQGGCSKAAYYLGKYYENGITIEADQEKALEIYMAGAGKYEEDCRDAVKRLKGDAYGNNGAGC